MAKISRIALAAAVATTSACGTAASERDRAEGSGVEAELVVLAAASLSGVFDDIADAFEATYPDVDVVLSFAASSSLAVSVEEGAPADVLASANAELMQRLDDGGHLDGAVVDFATNDLAIAVPVEGGDGVVSSLDDFARDELFIGMCASHVPCGSYADELLRRAGVNPAIDTRTNDVRGVVTLLAEGELDAGIVYGSDVVANRESIRSIPIDASLLVTATYPVAALGEAPNPMAARRFVDFLAGPGAREFLTDAGFGTP